MRRTTLSLSPYPITDLALTVKLTLTLTLTFEIPPAETCCLFRTGWCLERG